MLGFIWAFSQAMTLVEMAGTNPDIVVVSQDMGNLSPFTETFPDRIFDVGITEANLIGVAAGLAHAGKLPFVFAMAPFVSMRSFEQLRNDCSYNRNNVNIIAPCSGLETGAFGATHHAVEDLGLLRMIPGMTVLCPADPNEGTQAVKAAADTDGPTYIRFGYIEPIEGYEESFKIGQAPVMREGKDVTIMATGASVSQALKAHDLLKEEGISARVVNMHSIKPLDRHAIEKAAQETGCIITVEEHFIAGGLGSAVAEVLAETGAGRLVRLGLKDEFVMDVASYPDILGLVGLDAASIAGAVRSALT
ncbi:MAG: hypothetical protein GY864_10995 [Desulfobacterales bacterium]|nr:hypothetical protein [Desulfobacterales bacterium]